MAGRREDRDFSPPPRVAEGPVSNESHRLLWGLADLASPVDLRQKRPVGEVGDDLFRMATFGVLVLKEAAHLVDDHALVTLPDMLKRYEMARHSALLSERRKNAFPLRLAVCTDFPLSAAARGACVKFDFADKVRVSRHLGRLRARRDAAGGDGPKY